MSLREIRLRRSSFAPAGLGQFCARTHGLRRGLHSFAASRLRFLRHNLSTQIRAPYFIGGTYGMWRAKNQHRKKTIGM